MSCKNFQELKKMFFTLFLFRSRVVCPVIDIIHDDTFAYVRSFELHWGAFNWELHFRWYPVGERELRKRKNDSSSPFR